MNISTADRSKFDVFEKLVKTGPNTVYGLYIALGKESWSQTTVHRIVKFLEQNKSIKIYSEETKTGRSGNVYGPTIGGLMWIGIQDKSLLDQMDDILGKWLIQPKFAQSKETIDMFGTEMLENNPTEAKDLFKAVCIYMVGMVEAWRAFEPTMGLLEEMYFGEIIASGKDPEKFLEFQKEIYNKLPGFKAGIDLRQKQTRQLFDSITQKNVQK